MATKKRLIDADALKANFVVLGEFAKDLWCAGAIRMAIDNAPTVDAVEVVHGRWCFMGVWEECSVCKYAITVDSERTNYCPNCGAKMDGERKENENNT